MGSVILKTPLSGLLVLRLERPFGVSGGGVRIAGPAVCRWGSVFATAEAIRATQESASSAGLVGAGGLLRLVQLVYQHGSLTLQLLVVVALGQVSSQYASDLDARHGCSANAKIISAIRNTPTVAFTMVRL